MSKHPALLLQHFQDMVCSHLAALEAALPQALEDYDANLRPILIAALTQLLVYPGLAFYGLSVMHLPLRLPGTAMPSLS